jgi:hypothetical protein
VNGRGDENDREREEASIVLLTSRPCRGPSSCPIHGSSRRATYMKAGSGSQATKFAALMRHATDSGDITLGTTSLSSSLMLVQLHAAAIGKCELHSLDE